MVNMSQLKLRKLSVFVTVCSTRVTSAVWCCRIERHSRTGTGVTHLPEVRTCTRTQRRYVGKQWCATMPNPHQRSEECRCTKGGDSKYGVRSTEQALLHWDMQICRCCQSARLPISLQAKSQQLFATQPGIAPSNNITACSHPRKPATERAHGDMESFPLAPSARSMSAIQAYGTCGYPESGHSHSLHSCGHQPITSLEY